MINNIDKTFWIAIFTFFSWFGEYVHNSDLPELTIFSPENSFTALIAISLFLAWWKLPFKRVTTALLLGWAILNLVGGLLSAIPFSFWVLGKLQTPTHLLKHGLYALAQLPLIITLLKFKKK